MNFTYKMIQIPQDITVKMKEHRGNEAAAYLESIANSQAADGWEFFRVDEIGVLIRPGCLAGLFGRKADYITYYVVTFRKPA